MNNPELSRSIKELEKEELPIMTPEAYGVQIFGDYTAHFPDIAALILRY